MKTLNLQSNGSALPVAGAPSIGLQPARFAPIDVNADQRPSFLTLVKVEARKLSDTRSGIVIASIIAALTVLIPVIQLVLIAAGTLDSLNFGDFLLGAETGIQLLLPVMVVLLVTGEWGQRTAMTTFTLVPNRGRILAAKFATAIGATLVAFAAVTLVAVIANVVSPLLGNPTTVWDWDVTRIGLELLQFVFYTLMAFALGTLILNSAGAIVAFYSILLVLPPMLFGLALIKPLVAVVDWINPSYGLFEVQVDPSNAAAWAHVAVAIAMWVGVPLALGIRRVLTTEIK